MTAAGSVAATPRPTSTPTHACVGRRVLGVLAAVLCASVLGGCGQKGPLSLPAPAPAASGASR